MPSIAAVVRQLTAALKPVICLDTCDILEIVECLNWIKPGEPRKATCVEAAQRLVGTLDTDPDRAQVIITELVATEWGQNIADIRTDAARFFSSAPSRRRWAFCILEWFIRHKLLLRGFGSTQIHVCFPDNFSFSSSAFANCSWASQSSAG